jgi:hypothetical protein
VSAQILLGTGSRALGAIFDEFGTLMDSAIARALNRAGVSMRTRMAQRVGAELKVKSGGVKDAMRLTNATKDRLTVRLAASGRPIPLIDFNARGPRPSRGRGTGVRTSLGPPAKGHYPHAFIAQVGKGGHVGVFMRKPGANRRGPKPHRSQLPIKELFGPSIPKVFTKFTPEVLDHGEESLLKNLQSELRYAMSQAAQ